MKIKTFLLALCAMLFLTTGAAYEPPANTIEMSETTKNKDMGKVVTESPFFKDLLDSMADEKSAGAEMARVLKMDYEDYNDSEKDLFFAWHKHRVLETDGVKKILPKNVETHTLVTEKGNVCIIRKPEGRVLGQVMSKIGRFNNDPDYYEAGSIILRECKVFMEKPIETDADDLFSIKMACLGATDITETQIKKN